MTFAACGDWRLGFSGQQSGKSGVRVRGMAAAVSPGASRKKTEGPSKYSFIYVLTRRTESLSLKKIFFFMFSRLTNRCVLSSLSAAALSLGLFSCGGSGSSGDGESLPSGTMLDLSASLSTEDGLGPWNIIVKLTGNGSDLPR